MRLAVCFFIKLVGDAGLDIPALVGLSENIPCDKLRSLLLPANSCIETMHHAKGKTNGVQSRSSGASVPYLLCAEKSSNIDPMTHCWTKNDITVTTFFLAFTRAGFLLPPEPPSAAVFRCRDLSIAINRCFPQYQKVPAKATPKLPSPVAKTLTAASVSPTIATAVATTAWIEIMEYAKFFPMGL